MRVTIHPSSSAVKIERRAMMFAQEMMNRKRADGTAKDAKDAKKTDMAILGFVGGGRFELPNLLFRLILHAEY